MKFGLAPTTKVTRAATRRSLSGASHYTRRRARDQGGVLALPRRAALDARALPPRRLAPRPRAHAARRRAADRAERDRRRRRLQRGGGDRAAAREPPRA